MMNTQLDIFIFKSKTFYGQIKGHSYKPDDG